MSEAASSASGNNSVHEHVMNEVSPGALSSKEGAVHDDGNQMASQKCAVSGSGKPDRRKMVTHVQAEANSMAPTLLRRRVQKWNHKLITIQVAVARLKGLRALMVQSKIIQTGWARHRSLCRFCHVVTLFQ